MGLDLPHSDKLAKAEQLLEELVAARVRDLLSTAAKTLIKRLKSKIRENFSDILNENPLGWSSVLESKYLSEYEIALNKLQDKCKTFNKYPFFEEFQKQTQDDCAVLLQDLLFDELGKSMIAIRASRIFENLFRYDESGRPRLWNGNTHIDEIYDSALKKVSRMRLMFRTYF